MRRKPAKRRKLPKARFIVEFALSDAPDQFFRAHFTTARKALRFIDFNDENELLCYAALIH